MESFFFEVLTSSAGAAVLLGFVGWLSRTWLKERLTASLRLETEQKITRLKSELETANQRIHDLTAVGTSANSHVESALFEHRVAAVKTAWESVLAWQQVSVATMMVSVLPEDWVKNYASDPGTKSTFEQVLKGVDLQSFMKRQNETELMRPFLSESAWALCSAYHSFLSARLTKAIILTIPGVNHAKMLSQMNERDLVEKSAPSNILVLYDENPYAATEPYLRFMREKILDEFREFLSGERAGSKAVQDAALILKAAERLSEESLRGAQEAKLKI